MQAPAMIDIIRKGDEEAKNSSGTPTNIEDLWK